MKVPTANDLRLIRNKFNQKYIPMPLTGCWIWTGQTRCCKEQEKPIIGVHCKGRQNKFSASRISYILFKGPIPAGLQVLHTCDQPLCVNPDHLFTGTQEDNMKDCAEKGRNRTGRSNSVVMASVVPEIRRRYADGESARVIGLDFNIHRTTVYKIAQRKTWRTA